MADESVFGDSVEGDVQLDFVESEEFETSEPAQGSTSTPASQTYVATETSDDGNPHIRYEAHVQSRGWLAGVEDGQTAGTIGKALRLEALRVGLVGMEDTHIEMRAHVQKLGWQDGWVSTGEIGTVGNRLRMEAIQLRLVGGMAPQYDLEYRTHVQGIGWQPWRRNGEVAGTYGRSLRIEAIEIRLVEKPDVRVSYCAHVQSIGWQERTDGPTVAGTTGRGLRVEGLRAWVENGRGITGGIAYAAHVQGIGWQPETGDGGLAGTVGERRRLEALRIRLTGDMPKHYDIWYRVHVQSIGWTAWAANGDICGSTGLGLRAEAVQMRVLPLGSAQPVSSDAGTSLTCVSGMGVAYQSFVQGSGWQAGVDNGAVSGTTGKGLRVEGLKANLTGATTDGSTLQYRASMESAGWGPWASGDDAGAGGSGKRIEAIQMRLSGTAASLYNVWYRVHVQGFGWMGWTCNGASAGTAKLSRRIEAMQVRLVRKGIAAPGSTSRPFTDVYKHPTTILIGDSRTVSMYFTNNGGSWSSEINRTDKSGVVWSAKVGAGYDWMVSTGVPNVEGRINKTSAVVILMGVNDALKGSAYWSKYLSYLNAKAAQWTAKGASVYYMAIGPVGKRPGDDVYTTRWGNITNSGHVIPWNNAMRKGLTPNVNFLDTYGALSTSYRTVDGVHYDQATNWRFYDYIEKSAV